MAYYNDYTGFKFGKLTAICLVEKNGQKHRYWKCRCECGNEKIVDSGDLRKGHTRSCGCARGTRSLPKWEGLPPIPRKAIHIQKCEREYSRTKHPRLRGVWSNMKDRCQNPNNKRFYCYGGRGIKVCDEWQTFAPFCQWALESGYDEGAKFGECTIDRIDVDGDYEPNNCRWVSMDTQEKNRRCCKSYKGGEKC